MSRETLDTIPSGKDPFAVGQLIAGVTTATPDVGGTQIMQQPTLQVHGSSNNDNVFMIDNVQIQHIGFGGNQTGFYFNDGLMDEISYQTSSLPAEAPVGGVQINMIPRDGGNQFHGSALRHRRQRVACRATTWTTSCVALGFSAQNRVDTVYDFNATLRRADHARPAVVLQHVPALGGQQLPRQHLHGHRRAGARRSAPHRRHPAPDRAADPAQQARRCTTIAASSGAATGRTTGSAPASTSRSRRSCRRTGLNYIGQAEMELADLEPAAGRSLGLHAAGQLQPVVPARRGARTPSPPSTRSDRIITGVSPRQDINTARMCTYAGFVSYVTGAHNLKAGLQVRTGWSQELFETRGDIVQIVNNGVPNSVRLVNNPERPQGVGRQHRLLRPGLVDASAASRSTRGCATSGSRCRFPQQSAGAGRWVPAREFAEQNEHRQLEHALAALRPLVGPVRRRPHRGEGRPQPLRPPGGRHDHPAAQRQEHRLPDLPVGRRQRRPARARNRDCAFRAAPARFSRASATSTPT